MCEMLRPNELDKEGSYRCVEQALETVITLEGFCPGPGSSWGNLTGLPPSKEGESPSTLGSIGAEPSNFKYSKGSQKKYQPRWGEEGSSEFQKL